jgi:hypothetical protein
MGFPMTEDCPAIKFSRQENRNDELPAVPEWTHPSVKAQRDHRKKNSAYAFGQAISVRRMRPSFLPLVFHHESQCIPNGSDNR